MRFKDIELNRELKFGVEMEISNIDLSKYDLASKLRENGIEARALNSVEHSGYNSWKIERDGSLSGANTMEIVSPVLVGVDGLMDLNKVTEVLNEYNAEVNTSCGVHVHHEASDLRYKDIKNVYKIYAKHEEAINGMLPKSRVNNSYAKTLKDEFEVKGESLVEIVDRVNSIEELKEEIAPESWSYYQQERYYKVNFVAYVNHGTLEFRQHSGTTDYEKLSNWIILTHLMIEKATEKKFVRMKSDSRLNKCSKEDGYVHRNYDLYKELDINGTEVAKYVGDRNKKFREQWGNNHGLTA